MPTWVIGTPSECAAKRVPASASRRSSTSSVNSMDCFWTAPSARTTTSRATRGPRPTSCTERMAADSCDGPTTMAVQSVRSASRPEVRSNIDSISPWAWSKNWRTW